MAGREVLTTEAGVVLTTEDGVVLVTEGVSPPTPFASKPVLNEAGTPVIAESGAVVVTEGYDPAPAPIGLPPTIPVPTGLPPTYLGPLYLKRVSPTMTLGALDAFGHRALTVASQVTEDWGRLQVTFGGVDVTFLRGAPCEVVSWSTVEPFGDETAVIKFPQISPFETLGAGGLAAFTNATPVVIRRVFPTSSGEAIEDLWRGLWVSEDVEADESSGGTTFHCIGELFEADLRVAKPTLDPTILVDVHESIYEALSGFDHSGDRFRGFRFGPPTARPANLGVTTANLAHYQQLLTGYTQDLLAIAYNPTTGVQSTVTNVAGRAEIVPKNMTTAHHVLTVGTPGLSLRLSRDLVMAPNAIYGSGQSPEDGCDWRNSKYPGLPSPDPLAQFNAYVGVLYSTTQVEPYTYNAAGFATGSNPGYDPSVLRVERYESFGKVSRAEGVKSAQDEVAREASADHYAGSMTLKIDPQGGSRWAIRAGTNVQLVGLRGATRLFHVAHTQHNVEGGTVELTVDTQGRDRPTLAAVLERRRDNLDIVRRPRPALHATRIVNDKVIGWDCESGSGIIPATSVPALGWAVRQIPAATRGTMRAINLQADRAVEMSVAVFDRAIAPSELAAKGSPADADYWSIENWPDTSGLVQAIGAGDDLGGYWPKAASDEDAVITGRVFSDSSFDFDSQSPPWLWVAMWATGAASMAGRLYPGPQL